MSLTSCIAAISSIKRRLMEINMQRAELRNRLQDFYYIGRAISTARGWTLGAALGGGVVIAGMGSGALGRISAISHQLFNIASKPTPQMLQRADQEASIYCAAHKEEDAEAVKTKILGDLQAANMEDYRRAQEDAVSRENHEADLLATDLDTEKQVLEARLKAEQTNLQEELKNNAFGNQAKGGGQYA